MLIFLVSYGDQKIVINIMVRIFIHNRKICHIIVMVLFEVRASFEC